jgi:two-component system chemotaxis sensor kinase CheA
VAAVLQAVRLDASGVSTVENQEVITVRDKVIPLVRISRVFSYAYHADTGQLPSAPSEQSNASLHVVVIQGEGREIGLVVDELMGSQDIVIKSLEDELADARGVAGAAILGDGSVTLILDIAELQKIALDSERMTELEFGAEIERFRDYLRNRAPELPPPQLN